MKKYIPDNNFIKTINEAKRFALYPLMAIFEFDNKRLIYIGTAHNGIQRLAPESFDAINYAFKKFDIDCVVTEFEHTYKNIEDRPGTRLGQPEMNELAYSVYVAQKKNIPYIFADTDLIDRIKDLENISHHKAILLQTMYILDDARKYKKFKKINDTVVHAFSNVKKNFAKTGYDMSITIEEFKDCVQKDFNIAVSDENISDILDNLGNWQRPNAKGNIVNKIQSEIDFYSRDPYMIENIFKAINEYNNVLVTMGSGHYETQRLVLEKVFGSPKYIYKFPRSERIDINSDLSLLSLVLPPQSQLENC